MDTKPRISGPSERAVWVNGMHWRTTWWSAVASTDPRISGLDEVQPPSGVAIVPAGQADESLLRSADQLIRAEVEASVGWWQSMPAEVLPRHDGDPIVDPSKYAVAAAADRYLGLIRVVTVIRPRIGLVAVRSGERRRGIARALLAHALQTLHRSGYPVASADVHESNRAASALFEGAGARPASSNLELVR